MFRSFLAVFVGYLVMAISTMIAVMLLDLAFASGSTGAEHNAVPSTSAILLNLLSGVVCAIFGGYVTSAMASRGKFEHSLALAAIVLFLGIAYAIQMRSGPQPGWYLAVLPICGAAGVIIGGVVGGGRLRPKPFGM